MIELALRLGVAFAAGALCRMLQVFELIPWPVALLLLLLAGGGLSMGLLAARIFVALLVSAGYYIAYGFTAPPAVENGPAMLDIAALVFNGLQLFLPFGLPALGSGIAYKLEERRQSDEEVTEEALLSQKLPELPTELTYNPPDLDEIDLPPSAMR